MKADLAKLRALHEAATPGPWQSMNEYQWDSIIGDIDGPDDGDMHYELAADITSHHDRSRANAALIVAAVNALPELLAIAEAVERAPVVELVLRDDDRGNDWLECRHVADRLDGQHKGAASMTIPEGLQAALDKLQWCGEPHITRDYRTVTFGEYEARLLHAAITESQQANAALARDAARYVYLAENANRIDAGPGNSGFRWEWESDKFGERDKTLDAAIDAAIEGQPHA